MVKISTLIPPSDDKERSPLSNGMELQIIHARVIHGARWDTAQIDSITPKGNTVYLYTTSKVITTKISQILLIHTPTKEEPIECRVKELSSAVNPELNYLTLED